MTQAALSNPAGKAPDAAVALLSADSLRDEIVAALRTVRDPEIPLNIYDLGLIYAIDIGETIHVDMTLTAPGCPVATEIVRNVELAVRGVEGVQSVEISLVFDPPWDQSKMSDEAKLELGLI
jgi:FeS assembly SUF system protein